MRGRILAATRAAAVSMVAPAANAAVIQNFSEVTSATNGIVYDPATGNFWVVEEFNDPNPDAVVEMSPSGLVLRRFSLGNDPTSIALGPNHTVWVSVTGADQL